MMKKLAAEFFGTFILVFAGTGAIVINDVSTGRGSPPGSPLAPSLPSKPSSPDRFAERR
jgi:glycerol uptake facilitator-like aquaporin